jgi:SRSO17 transposase
MCGQLSNLERKNIEAMVLALLTADEGVVRTTQHFVGQALWESDPFLEQAQRLVANWLGEPEGVVIIDGSEFPKQGSHSAGVAHQDCGHLGKAEYQDRRQACEIPDTLTFRTEPELGLEMIAELSQRAVLPFRWVTCDERYGEIPAFLEGIAALGKW